MDKDLISFFELHMPLKADEITIDAKREWGSMSVLEMIDHLSTGFRISLIDEEREILVPAHKLERAQAFLESDLPMRQNFAKPEQYTAFSLRSADLEVAKNDFLIQARELMDFFLANPDYTAIHPHFGRLNTRQWLLMHKKHIQHHFSQFSVQF
jgi:hypothetical protein